MNPTAYCQRYSRAALDPGQHQCTGLLLLLVVVMAIFVPSIPFTKAAPRTTALVVLTRLCYWVLLVPSLKSEPFSAYAKIDSCLFWLTPSEITFLCLVVCGRYGRCCFFHKGQVGLGGGNNCRCDLTFSCIPFWPFLIYFMLACICLQLCVTMCMLQQRAYFVRNQDSYLSWHYKVPGTSSFLARHTLSF